MTQQRTRNGLSESVMCQRIHPQNRLAEHSADFAGNLECYQENRNPELVFSAETRKFRRVTYVPQDYRTESWPLDMRYEHWI